MDLIMPVVHNDRFQAPRSRYLNHPKVDVACYAESSHPINALRNVTNFCQQNEVSFCRLIIIKTIAKITNADWSGIFTKEAT